MLEKLDWERNEIQFLVFVSQTPNYLLPSTAFYLQKELGIGKSCFCFDINLGCSGYAAGLQVIASLMQPCEEGSKGILLAGDTLSKFIDGKDSATNLLFGDAGTATALKREGDSGMKCMNASDGSGYDKIILRSGKEKLFMDGAAVFGFTIGQVTDSIQEFMKYYQIEKESIDFFVFHQAQKFILDTISELLDLEKEKVLSSYENYGNTSVASIPVTLCSNVERLKKGGRPMKMLLSGFGVGLAWGTVSFTLEADAVFPLSVLKEKEEEEN